MRAHPLFTWSSLTTRVSLGFLIVFGIYNPSGRSYYHFLVDGAGVDLMLRITLGIFLAAVLRIVVMIAWRAMGIYGSASFIVVALATTLTLWQGVSVDSWMLQTIGLVLAALYIGVGMSWSGILYRLSRQTQSVSIAQSRSPL